MASPSLSSLSGRIYTIHVCPECGEHCTESGYDAKRGYVYGHYHDPPEGWHSEDGSSGGDPWFDAVEVQVVPTSEEQG